MKFSAVFTITVIAAFYIFNWFNANRVMKHMRNSTKYAALYHALLKSQHSYYLLLKEGNFLDKPEIRKYIDNILVFVNCGWFDLDKFVLKSKRCPKTFQYEIAKLNNAEKNILIEISMLLGEIIKIKAPVYYCITRLKKIALMQILSLIKFLCKIVSEFSSLESLFNTGNEYISYDESDFLLRYKY